LRDDVRRAVGSANPHFSHASCQPFIVIIDFVNAWLSDIRQYRQVSSIISFVDAGEEFRLERYGELWGEIEPVRSVSMRRSGSERKWKCRGL
jgi:hypothetical protein